MTIKIPTTKKNKSSHGTSFTSSLSDSIFCESDASGVGTTVLAVGWHQKRNLSPVSTEHLVVRPQFNRRVAYFRRSAFTEWRKIIEKLNAWCSRALPNNTENSSRRTPDVKTCNYLQLLHTLRTILTFKPNIHLKELICTAVRLQIARQNSWSTV